MGEHELHALLHAGHTAGASEVLGEGEEEREARAEERGGGEALNDLGGEKGEEGRERVGNSRHYDALHCSTSF